MNPPAATSTGPARTCPECGWVEGAPAVRRPVRSFLAHATPVFVALAAALALTVWLALTASRNTVTSGGTIPLILSPAFTAADIDRIARGEPADPVRPGEPVLVRAILDAARVITPEYPGQPAVEVGYGPAAGTRTDTWSIGWPRAWFGRTRQSNYTDGARREGFKAVVTDPSLPPLPKFQLPNDPLRIPPRPRWEWFGSALQYQPPPEETGGVNTRWWIGVFAPVVLAGAVIAAWYLCGILIWVFNLFRSRERRQRGRRVRIAAAALVAVGMLAAGILNARSIAVPQYTFPTRTQPGIPSAPFSQNRPGYARLSWTRAELERLAAEPGADARVAAEIRSLNLPHPTPGAPESAYLAAAADCESEYAFGGSNSTSWSFNRTLPVVYAQRFFYTRRADFGTPEIMSPPAGVRFSASYGRLSAQFATGDPAKPVYGISVEWSILASIVVALWLLLWTTRLITIVRSRVVRARRLRRGCCPACAYPLPSAPRPAT